MAIGDVGASEKTGKGMHDRLQCVVVTPERTLFDQLVDFVALPLYDGELGVLPGRTPLIGRRSKPCHVSGPGTKITAELKSAALRPTQRRCAS